jgi:hypothetical protein
MVDTNFFHANVGTVSRRRGEFIGREIAYVTGEKIKDNYFGVTHDCSDRTDVLYSKVYLPEHAPQYFNDFETLVNAIETAEKRGDSRTGRHVTVSLKNNHNLSGTQAFTLEEYISMLRVYVQRAFLSQGMCAVAAIHEGKNGDPANDNPHAHIVLTDRPVDKEGFCAKKNRAWNKKSNITLWREQWAEIQNQMFERKGLKIKVSAKSLIMLGIERKPTKHLGKAVIALKNRGIETERSLENERIRTHNEQQLKCKSKNREPERNLERSR